MSEYLNEIWTNAEKLAKMVVDAYIANADKPNFKTNKAFYLAVLEELESTKDKSRFIGQITAIIKLIEDKKALTNIVKYIHNLPVKEIKAGKFRDFPENSFGYFHTTFYFLLRCEEIQKQFEKNVG